MTQKEPDRLVALKKDKKRFIMQKQAAAKIGVSGFWRKLLKGSVSCDNG